MRKCDKCGIVLMDEKDFIINKPFVIKQGDKPVVVCEKCKDGKSGFDVPKADLDKRYGKGKELLNGDKFKEKKAAAATTKGDKKPDEVKPPVKEEVKKKVKKAIKKAKKK